MPNRLSRFLRAFPFSLGLYRIWPGTYISAIPDRYGANLRRYLARGGSADGGNLKRFMRSNSPNNRGDLTRYFFFRLAIDQLQKEGIRGDVAELGVYKGSTAVLMVRLARLWGSTAYLLDTFDGFHDGDLDSRDRSRVRHFRKSSMEEVRELVGDTNVRFVRGRFPESADEIDASASFCLVHIDCDVYVPYIAALEYFYSRLVPGGFLIMHDYMSLHWDGAERAVDEFFVDKPEKPIPIPDKSGTVVIRKAATAAG
jgi:O-methyltransferase